MRELRPWPTGAALGLTVAIAYTVCAVVFYLWPIISMQFLNGLFHGLDFSKLETGAAWSFTAFACALTVMVIWGFLVGALFAWIFNRLAGASGDG
jgi:hypothetical protein